METFGKLKAGITHERDLTVKKKHSVSPSGTPMMIAFMEITLADLVQPLLPSRYTTVGYEVQVKHKAPAALGADVKVWAKLFGSGWKEAAV